MRQKVNLYGVLQITILAVVLLLAKTVFKTEYLFGWAEHNWKFYIGLLVIVIILIISKKQRISALLTTGIIVGIFVGNFLGKFIQDMNKAKIIEGMSTAETYRMHHNPGFEIWMGIILLFAVHGIILQIFHSKNSKKQ